MQYRKPHYYDKFSCTADKCPDTCCAGWQIVIDENSLERYGNVSGGFGIRLLNSIDWSEGVFEQYHRRCSFLNEQNLCDIYAELGADALCDTCRMYPRHVEEFENLRELSLSLSCPTAAEMILGCTEKVKFLEQEDELEECEEDYEDFDFLLFGQLEDTRKMLLNIIQNRELTAAKRMLLILRLTDKFQKALDEGWLFEWDSKDDLAYFEQEKSIHAMAESGNALMLQNREKMLEDLEKLEVLRENWPDTLCGLRKCLYENGAEFYEEIQEDFTQFIAETFGTEQWEIYQEQLLVFFLYTYFCGAVYDDMIYTKTVLTVFSTLWIEELLISRWIKQDRNLEFSDIVEVAYQYAREIEHSDDNLNMLEEIFDENPLYSPENLWAVMVERNV